MASQQRKRATPQAWYSLGGGGLEETQWALGAITKHSVLSTDTALGWGAEESLKHRRME